MQKIISQEKFKTLSVGHLFPSAYILRIERNNMDFTPGQYINIGRADDIEKRDYSVYSSINDKFIEVLVKEVEDGLVSKTLAQCSPGEKIDVSGPYGFFTLSSQLISNAKFLFIASGTGVSPFHSMIKSYPVLDYHLIHGVRYGNEAYGKEEYDRDRYTLCTSRDNQGNFHGRLTDHLRNMPVADDTLCYLCGNVNMIYDAVDILKEKGIPSSQIHTEVYF